jgi:hypothetical protein
MARQGHAFATAQEARVVSLLDDNDDTNVVLKDVPWDGKTVGEIVTRGNIVMKEVVMRFTLSIIILIQFYGSITATLRRQEKRSVEAISIRVILLSFILTAQYPL